MKRTITYLITILFLLVIPAACGSQEMDPSQFKGTFMPSLIPVPDFTLTNTAGESVNLSDYEGEIVLLYFGYTFCPDICPTTLSELSNVQRQLDDAGEKIQVVMVTVDPQRDTPENLGKYVTHFHPDFVGLSGTKAEIDAAGEIFGVYYEKQEGSEATGYLVDHTARVFVVDPQGNYQLSFSYGTPVADIVHDLNLLLRGM